MKAPSMAFDVASAAMPFTLDLRQLVRSAPRSMLASQSLAALSHRRSARWIVALFVSRQRFGAPRQAIAHNTARAARRSDKRDRRLSENLVQRRCDPGR